jgi:hypothetical protein
MTRIAELDKQARILFPSKDDKHATERGAWVEIVGQWRYNALLLADFNPIEGNRIFMEVPALDIYTALASKKAYTYHD